MSLGPCYNILIILRWPELEFSKQVVIRAFWDPVTTFNNFVLNFVSLLNKIQQNISKLEKNAQELPEAKCRIRIFLEQKTKEILDFLKEHLKTQIQDFHYICIPMHCALAAYLVKSAAANLIRKFFKGKRTINFCNYVKCHFLNFHHHQVNITLSILHTLDTL